MSSCDRCLKMQRHFKALENDLQFQIKKLNEDMAAQKITLQMSHQRELKKNADRINQQKTLKESQLKCWMQKYDETVAQYEEKLIKLREGFQKNLIKIKEQTTGAELIEMKQKEAKILEEKQILKQKLQAQKQKLILQNSQQIKIHQKQHEQQINKIKQLHAEENTFFLVENSKLNQKIKQLLEGSSSANKNLCQLNEELKMTKEQLNKVRQQLQDKTILIKIKVEMKQKQLKALKDETAEKINRVHRQAERQKKELNVQRDKKIKRAKEDCVKVIELLEKKLSELNKIRESDLRSYNENLEMLRRFSEEVYVPKNKFNEQINSLNVKLINKEKDVERAKHEIKQCKLEIVNKEETYIKFFPSGNQNYVSTVPAPEIFIRTPSSQRKREYSIKKQSKAIFCLDNAPLFKTRSNDSSARIINLNKSMTKANTYQNLDRLPVPEIEDMDNFSF